MALADFKFCEQGTQVQAVRNGDSYSVLVGGKVACSMSSGGAHKFRLRTEAEVFGRQLTRGYTAGVFLSADVANHVF